MRLLKIILAVVLLAALFSTLTAQDVQKGVQKGTISGRVVTEDGDGLPGITVTLTLARSERVSQRRTASTDDDGNFRFNDLPPGAYRISTLSGRAYVPAPTLAGSEPRLYRPGETVTLQMIKGGVITGRVTNAAGEPVVALQLSAIRLRSAEGYPVSGQVSYYENAYTDDRGVYRFYGLTPGTYIIKANGGPQFVSPPPLSPYDHQAPTYYPSSTRDTAVEVQVSSGGEATGVDIRYRGERGYAVSGRVADAKQSLYVELLDAGSGLQFASKYLYPGSPTGFAFDFYGVPDGEYEIAARSSDSNDASPVASAPRRITVRGADVTGMELRLLPLASIAGRVVLDTATPACEKDARLAFEEIAVAARPEEGARGEGETVVRQSTNESALDEKGQFEIRRLTARRYRLSVNLPREDLYVRSLVSGTAGTAAAARPRSAAAAPAAADLARQGVMLRQGEKLSGVTVTVAEGAASVRGRVAAEREGARLPARMRVHLVPAEPAAADDVLRYAEAMIGGDGAFVLSNIAPGKYWLIVRGVVESEPVDRMAAPAAWDVGARAKLRREAEAGRVEIELKSCQRLTDQILKYSGMVN